MCICISGVYHLDKALAAVNDWNLCLETWRAFHSHHASCAKNSTTAEARKQSWNVSEDDVSPKRRKLNEEPDEGGVTLEPTFRVSCKCSGSAAKFFTPQVIVCVMNRIVLTLTLFICQSKLNCIVIAVYRSLWVAI